MVAVTAVAETVGVTVGVTVVVEMVRGAEARVTAVAETVGAVEMDAPHKPGRRSGCMGIPRSRSPPSRPGCTPRTGGWWYPGRR